MKRYEALAADIEASICAGVLRPGDKLPSVRHTCTSRGVSASTVFQAYYLLEARGLGDGLAAGQRFGRRAGDAIWRGGIGAGGGIGRICGGLGQCAFAARRHDFALAQRQHAALEVRHAAPPQVLLDHPQVHVVQ